MCLGSNLTGVIGMNKSLIKDYDIEASKEKNTVCRLIHKMDNLPDLAPFSTQATIV